MDIGVKREEASLMSQMSFILRDLVELQREHDAMRYVLFAEGEPKADSTQSPHGVAAMVGDTSRRITNLLGSAKKINERLGANANPVETQAGNG